MPKRAREREGGADDRAQQVDVQPSEPLPSSQPPSRSGQDGHGQRPTAALARLAGDVGVRLQQVQAAARLLAEGCTLPFIARYRKEATQCLDEAQLRRVAALLEGLDRLEEQRQATLGKLEKLGVLDEGLKAEVQAAKSVQQIEDLYLPHRPKRATKASAARDKGLGPLAEVILRGGRSRPGEPSLTPEAAARSFVKQPDVPSTAEALAGAQDILAEMAAELPAARERARSELRAQGVLVSQLSRAAKQAQQGGSDEGKAGGKCGKGQEGGGGKKAKGGSAKAAGSADAGTYAMYHDFRSPVRSVRPHQVLALNRGEAQGLLSLSFQWVLEGVEALCLQLLGEQGGAGQLLPAAYASLVKGAVQSGLKRLLKPAIEREIRGQLTEEAGAQAAQAFSRNLRNLLMQPPLPGVVVLGVDPAYRTGCKLAVCDATGKVLETGVVYPHPPAAEAQRKQAAPLLTAFVKKHGVQAVAIGNGTASRETQRFVAEALAAAAGLAQRVGWCVVSEAGASVYSACDLAAKELPGLDVTLRGAVSIARRLQDPLSELVKVPPESLGVGQYQADLKAATLAAELAGVVESVVNAVGVDLNAASPALLTHVAGLNRATAAAIVAQRDSRGPFSSREQLLKVKGIGPRTFQQCAGFLRVRGGSSVLDSTAVHPESYAAAQALVLEACGVERGASPAGPAKKKRKKADGSKADQQPSQPLTPGMLQQARPALRALLGQQAAGAPAPAQQQGAGAGAESGGQQAQQSSSRPNGKKPSGRPTSSAAGGTAGGAAGGAAGGGSYGVWVSGEGLQQVAARLGVGEPTLVDILDSLLAPERDVRGQAGLASLQFKQALSISDLAPGMELAGVIRNVVDFGAFVDINAGQDGLIHVSELRRAAQRAQHGQQPQQRQQGREGGGVGSSRGGGPPADAYSLAAVGDLVRVRVLSVDPQRKRICLAPV